MDTPLAGERIPEEKAYTRRYLDSLASRPVNYPADCAPPLEGRPRKVPVVAAHVAAPPDMDVDDDEGGAQDTSITLTIKSLRPALTIPVTASLTDSVADLKILVASQPGAPAADAQRLVLKGKALADSKLLKEYDLADGAVVHLMIKPGAPVGAAAAASSAAAAVPPAAAAAPADLHLNLSSVSRSRSASSSSIPPRSPTPADAPHLTITTPAEGATPSELPDGFEFDSRSDLSSPVASAAFHTTAASPNFWQKVHDLCHAEFSAADDADTVFDTFLMAMKGRLSASETAKIRDVVGVAGMGGGA